jgi:xanthine/CO dehydrogenase XdhC/CoxF family maturation factor
MQRIERGHALGELASGITSTRHYGAHGEAREETVTVFIESFALPPRMVIFGAVDFTAALTRVAKVLGYRVTVCDARAVFATVQRFPMADEVVNDWPDRYLAKIGDELGPRDVIRYPGALSGGYARITVHDKGKRFNSDLLEAIELGFLLDRRRVQLRAGGIDLGLDLQGRAGVVRHRADGPQAGHAAV